MPKTFAAVLLLAVLALALPGKAVAGPPEGISGRMVFDEVGDWLKKYQKENDEGKRVKWLRRLAPTRDPRVAVVLSEAYFGRRPTNGRTDSRYYIVLEVLLFEFVRGTKYQSRSREGNVVYDLSSWWDENAAELRRRAKQLPQ
jgi:hypothetical protein